jgi:RNA polymerase sigma factor (TIGR02999 family)
MSPVSTGEITALLRAWSAGDAAARDRLASLVYADLRRLAHARLRGGSPSLSPTDVVHEAYLRLLRQDARWDNRVHFFAVAAQMMRRVLVDRARAAGARKRGGRAVRVDLSDIMDARARADVDLVDLDRALNELFALDPEQARVVELRYFGGLTFEEIAETVGISASSAKRGWTSARLWLHRRLRSDDPARADRS